MTQAEVDQAFAQVAAALRTAWVSDPRACRDNRCGHPEEIHQHYRPGTDCSIMGCPCRSYRAPLPAWMRRPGTAVINMIRRTIRHGH